MGVNPFLRAGKKIKMAVTLIHFVRKLGNGPVGATILQEVEESVQHNSRLGKGELSGRGYLGQVSREIGLKGLLNGTGLGEALT